MGDIDYDGDVDGNRKIWQKAMLYSFAFGEPFPLLAITHILM